MPQRHAGCDLADVAQGRTNALDSAAGPVFTLDYDLECVGGHRLQATKKAHPSKGMRRVSLFHVALTGVMAGPTLFNYPEYTSGGW
jgi:hypothetical protein